MAAHKDSVVCEPERGFKVKTLRSRWTFSLAVGAAGLLVAGVAIAVPITKSGGAINQVRVVTERDTFDTQSEAFVDVPGATVNINAPTAGALLLMRFSGESVCARGSGTGVDYCSVRILVDGVEADPAVGVNFAFHTVIGTTTLNGESHSMDRSRRVGSGAHTVQVQARVVDVNNDSDIVFFLDDWSLTVERSKV
jgi:hypothetical protein